MGGGWGGEDDNTERRARTTSWAVVGMLARTVDRLEALFAGSLSLSRVTVCVCVCVCLSLSRARLPPCSLPLSITHKHTHTLSLSRSLSRVRALSLAGYCFFFLATAKRWGQKVGLPHSSFFSLSLPPSFSHLPSLPENSRRLEESES